MNYLEDLNEILLKWGEQVADKIKRNLDDTGTTASGKTKNSIEVVVVDGDLQIIGRQYFRSVEEGRPAGKIPYKFNEIIRKWMDDKNIADNFGTKEYQKRNAAWIIAQKIKDSGTKLYRDGGREDIYTDVINEELPKLFNEISGKVTQTIVKDLK